MGKLSKSKTTKSSSAQIHGQTSMLSFFSKVPAGQSKLFNQLPPTTSKPARVNKLSRTANKKARQDKKVDDDSKQVTLLEIRNPSDGTVSTAQENKMQTSTPGRDGSEEEEVITIPETPESIASTTPSSSRKPTKYNIPETPTSTKSTSIRFKASSPSPSRLSTSTSNNTPQRHPNSSSLLLHGASKLSNIQGYNSNQGVNSASVHKINSGDDANNENNDDSDDDDDDYLSIPETQFCIPET
ncbi:uncharacterized protein [Amphiura filiformis]|uniref:uncharacterized protein n=1 Tax=Amphiura filiformis TaxID=82378 RepID=UPI003B210875